jgi:hypothetical protein
MPSPRAFVALAAGASYVSAACWLASTSFDGLVDDRLDAAADARGADDAPASEVAVEVPDVEVTEGGAADAHDGMADASPATWCRRAVPPAQYCADFDDGTLLGTMWQKTDTAGNGRLEIDSDASSSPPNALHAFVPGSLATDASASALLVLNAGHATRARYAFDIRLGECSASPNGLNTLAALAFLDEEYIAAFVLEPAGFVAYAEQYTPPDGGVPEGGPMATFILRKGPVAGVWSRLALDITFDSGPVVVTLDGDVVLSMPRTAFAAPPRALTINLGLDSSGGTAACDVEYDNATLDLDP